jgi:hypothetical protein
VFKNIFLSFIAVPLRERQQLPQKNYLIYISSSSDKGIFLIIIIIIIIIIAMSNLNVSHEENIARLHPQSTRHFV